MNTYEWIILRLLILIARRVPDSIKEPDYLRASEFLITRAGRTTVNRAAYTLGRERDARLKR